MNWKTTNMAKKILTGTVVSTTMKNTVIVSVERQMVHPLYKKRMRRTKRYKVHVEDGTAVAMGATVVIEETRPLSHDKHFKLATIVS